MNLNSNVQKVALSSMLTARRKTIGTFTTLTLLHMAFKEFFKAWQGG
jgi:hypothetical protein